MYELNQESSTSHDSYLGRQWRSSRRHPSVPRQCREGR